MMFKKKQMMMAKQRQMMEQKKLMMMEKQMMMRSQMMMFKKKQMMMAKQRQMMAQKQKQMMMRGQLVENSLAEEDDTQAEIQNQDCAVTAWSPWSEQCSASCGRGFRQRFRQVTRPSSGSGRPCPMIPKPRSR